MVEVKRKGRRKGAFKRKSLTEIERRNIAIDKTVKALFGEKVDIIESNGGKRTYVISDNFIAQFNSTQEVREIFKKLGGKEAWMKEKEAVIDGENGTEIRGDGNKKAEI